MALLMKNKILHIHSDFPDGRSSYPSTKAVSNLIDNSSEYDHYVISINRTSNPFKVSVSEFEYGISVVYWCIPIGYLYRVGMQLLCYILKRKLYSIDFNLIHAHKLTTEGIVALYLSRERRVPYVVSVRGGTDLKNIAQHKSMRNMFTDIYSNSSFIFWVSPWAKAKVKKLLSVGNVSSVNFPNPCDFNGYQCLENKVSDFYTVLSFHQYKRKGIIGIIKAINLLVKKGLPVVLHIYGTGDEKVVNHIRSFVIKCNLEEHVVFKGQVNHAVLMKEIPYYTGLVSPATNETFGMAYIEALSSGVPVIAHSKTGIDGYFLGPYAQFLSSQCHIEIANAMEVILENKQQIKAALIELQASGGLSKFTLSNVVSTYESTLKEVLNA